MRKIQRYEVFVVFLLIFMMMQSNSALRTRPTSLMRCSASRSSLRAETEIAKFDVPLPSLATVNAVESLRAQYKKDAMNVKSEYFPVRPADLCQATGSMDLSMAQKELSALGYVVGSSLTVNDDGEIVYSFSSEENVLSAVRSSNRNLFMRSLWAEKIYPAALTATKISFGLFLISSLLIAATAVTAALVAGSSSSSSSSESERNKKSSYSSSSYSYRPNMFSVVDIVSDLSSPKRLLSSQNPDEKLSFLASFFSFVFGDGDPNKDFEKIQLMAAMKIIRANKGVVCAEQLAPVLSPPNVEAQENSQVVDESWMLDTVLKLEGVPVVTEEGDILYVFGNVVEEKFASMSNIYIEPVLTEKSIELSRATRNGLFFNAPALLGILNAVGVYAIGNIVNKGSIANSYPFFHQFLRATFPALFVYSVSYITLPIVRGLILMNENKAIEERNLNRKNWYSQLVSKSGYIPRKLLAIAEYVRNKK